MFPYTTYFYSHWQAPFMDIPAHQEKAVCAFITDEVLLFPCVWWGDLRWLLCCCLNLDEIFYFFSTYWKNFNVCFPLKGWNWTSWSPWQMADMAGWMYRSVSLSCLKNTLRGACARHVYVSWVCCLHCLAFHKLDDLLSRRYLCLLSANQVRYFTFPVLQCNLLYFISLP